MSRRRVRSVEYRARRLRRQNCIKAGRDYMPALRALDHAAAERLVAGEPLAVPDSIPCMIDPGDIPPIDAASLRADDGFARLDRYTVEALDNIAGYEGREAIPVEPLA